MTFMSQAEPGRAETDEATTTTTDFRPPAELSRPAGSRRALKHTLKGVLGKRGGDVQNKRNKFQAR